MHLPDYVSGDNPHARHYQYAPCTPHIDLWPIHGRTEEEFRRSVPLSDDPVRVITLPALLVKARESEVGELQLSSVVHEDVGPLDIPMNDALVVEVCQSSQHLTTERLEVRLCKLELRL